MGHTHKLRRARVWAFAIAVSWFAGAAVGDDADWPQWRHDAHRTAATTMALDEQLVLHWKRVLPAPQPAWPPSQPSLRFDVSYSPVAAGGRLLVPSMVRDSVSAYDTKTGKLIWEYAADGPVRFAPVAHEDRVYFAADDGRLYCVNAESGTLVWRYDGAPAERIVWGNERLISSWPARGAPVLHDGTIYFSTGIWCFMGVFVHAVDAETGQVRWINSGDAMTYQPQPHGGAVSFAGFVPRGYFGIGEGRLIAPGGRTPPASYDLGTGKLLDFKWTPKGSRAWQVYGDPLVITAAGKEIRAESGKVHIGQGTATFDGDPWTLLAADHRLFVVTTDGTIYCFGPSRSEEAAVFADTTDRHDLPASDGRSELPELEGLSQEMKKVGGYAVLAGPSSKPLAEALLKSKAHHIVVFHEDGEAAVELRRDWAERDIYGRRVTILAGAPSLSNLPPLFADLVVFDHPGPLTSEEVAKQAATAARLLQPYGGTAWIAAPDEQVRRWARVTGPSGLKIENAGGRWTRITREGALPGSASWSHQYADSANTITSHDALVRPPFGLLWFGNGPSNDEVLPRHGHGPSPQVAAGRLVIEGPDMLRCLDVYTGRLLWQRELPGLGEFYDNTSHQPGAGEIGSNYVTLPDAVYVIWQGRILKLDPRTGDTQGEYTFVPEGADEPEPWGFLAVWQDYLIGTVGPFEVTREGAKLTRFASGSRRLVVLDRHSGRVLWQRGARYNFRHNNIAIGNGRVFCIDGLSPAKLDLLRRRGLSADQFQPNLLALDVATGNVLWSTTDNVFGTFLNYSAQYDVLLQAGSANRDRAKDEIQRGMVAYRGADGSVLWQQLERTYSGPCILWNDWIIAQGPAYSLLTGEPIRRTDPITGDSLPWDYTRTYGCNTAIASQHILAFRSGAAGYFDLEHDGGTGNLGGFKSSCTSNLIPADGVLSAPEYTRTCVCNYQNQTSLAVVHDPTTEMWTFNGFNWNGNRVRRLGINLGAPGDRKTEDGTLWLDFPSVGGPSPDVPVQCDPEPPLVYRHHSSLVRPSAAEETLPWIVASGVEGLLQLKITLSRQPVPPATYRVRLYFGEMSGAEPGERVFRVDCNGRTMIDQIDVAGQVGARTGWAKEFMVEEVGETLMLDFVPLEPGKGRLPILSGVLIESEG